MNKIAIPTLEGFEILNISDITHLESKNTYTTFYIANGKNIVSSKNIGFYEEKLYDLHFLRVHHSFIVNVKHILKYIRADNGYLLVTNNKLVLVSKSKKDILMNLLKKIVL